jgi:8-oxo-dGTP diphosphatase
MHTSTSATVHYVVGFMFNPDKSCVALIQKTHPDWQRGKLNGVGGKIEPDETPEAAMLREWTEETHTTFSYWKLFCTLETGRVIVYFYAGWSLADIVFPQMPPEEEQVSWHLTAEVMRASLDIIPNLRWLIPMALDESVTCTAIEKSGVSGQLQLKD